MPGRIAVVDLADRFERWEERRRVHDERLVHRSIHVILLDPAGKLVIQKRHRDKQTHPSTWDVSCSGHVEESDYRPRGATRVSTRPSPAQIAAGPAAGSEGGRYDVDPEADLDRVYLEVAGRELEEELGVRASDLHEPLVEIARSGPIDGVHYEQIRLFLGTSGGPYRPQPDEVEEVRSVTRAELAALAVREPVTPTLLWLGLAHAPAAWR